MKPINYLFAWQNILFSLALIVFTVGCGQGGDGQSINIDYSQLKLASIKDEPLRKASSSDFSRYLKNGIRMRVGGWSPAYALAEPNDNGQFQSRFSTTNVHEIGVDEDDRLKYDGEYLYLMEDYYSPLSETQQQPLIRIMQTNPMTAQVVQIASIENLADNLPYSGMYLHQLAGKKSLVTLSASRFYAWDAILADNDWRWTSGKTAVRVHDVSDPANPQLDWQLELEGNLEGSRKIGNKLYLITHFVPNIAELNNAALTDDERRKNEKLIRDTPISDLLPHYQINDGGIRTLVSAEDCLVAGDIDPAEGYADIITISSIDLDSHQLESSTCLNANVQGIYSSTQSLYIGASGNVSWSGFSQGTAIHKFALTDQGGSYRGSGWIEGSLGWQDPAFRMSEFQGDLRVVTSQFINGQIQHHLTILREGDNSRLALVSSLPNDTAPAPIGKPGEDIFAVRFVEDKAYIITYQQIDPLYQLDLSDPLQPFIASEIEIPGFARYLHPLSEGWLLGIGQQVEDNLTGGLKLELYDIRDVANPQVKDTVLIGAQGTWSEALFDLKSISYFERNSDVRQLSLPINRYEDGSLQNSSSQNGSAWVDSGLYLFDISGFETGELRLSRAGEMIVEESTPENSYPVSWGNGRSTLTSESIFYFQGNDLWSAKVNNLTEIYGPF